MYAVIMAGGGGTRLHPLSRPERPKPFLPLTSSRTLLQATVDRVADLVDGRVWVVADGRYRRLVEDQTPEARLLAEPMGRNTAAAIALATLAIDEPEDAVMVVLPADQTIEDVAGFQDVLRGAEQLAQGAFDIEDPLVTLGVQHHGRPATEYGYLIPNGEGADLFGIHAYPLKGFEEKPNPARAEELVRQPGVAWNAGMFLWRRRAIRAALERHTGFIQSLGPMVGVAGDARAGLRIDPAPDVDRPRRHGGRGRARPGGHGLDGRRLVRPGLVDVAARGDLRPRDRGRS